MCGLKLEYTDKSLRTGELTPFVGVWIETIFDLSVGMAENVTPFVGVWIETRETL